MNGIHITIPETFIEDENDIYKHINNYKLLNELIHLEQDTSFSLVKYKPSDEVYDVNICMILNILKHNLIMYCRKYKIGSAEDLYLSLLKIFMNPTSNLDFLCEPNTNTKLKYKIFIDYLKTNNIYDCSVKNQFILELVKLVADPELKPHIDITILKKNKSYMMDIAKYYTNKFNFYKEFYFDLKTKLDKKSI